MTPLPPLSPLKWNMETSPQLDLSAAVFRLEASFLRSPCGRPHHQTPYSKKAKNRGGSAIFSRNERRGPGPAQPSERSDCPQAAGKPTRPQPGSFTAGRLKSRPATRPRTLISTPSIHARLKPANPHNDTCRPVWLGDNPKEGQNVKTWPKAGGRSPGASSGTSR